ncbi:hypothetical protein V6N11_018557 [Hibiscus sabdariffa]|uniref:NADH:quinone oxidoreductase/Mrp antiporter transmembrane domain-containing protein n=1 Tax=Hibiscus sabdariffa TaxID=183260 RepID=A0ABR1ZH26_9ROSI
MAIAEFMLFVLTATLGGMFLCSANDLITIFVAPECFSLCSYLLSGYTKKDVRSNEATTKYLLMGGASSSILVHGFSWLYGSSGGEIELQEIVNGLINTQMYNSPGISIALIFITVGIGFKLSPAPSHQWTPDVYEGVQCYIVGSHPSETTSVIGASVDKRITPTFPTCPTVAKQFLDIKRTSPKGNFNVADFPSFAISFATAPAALANCPPLPSVISMLCMVVPNGISVEVDSSF